MAESIYFTGKAKWARLITADSEYQKWSMDLYFTPQSLDDFKALKLKTHLKKDDDGYYARLSRPTQKMMRNVMTAFSPPKVFDKDGKPLEGVMIGNGSDVTVKCELYKYTAPGSKEKQNAIRLESVRVDNLVPYEPKKDFDKVTAAAAEGLTDQPAPLF